MPRVLLADQISAVARAQTRFKAQAEALALAHEDGPEQARLAQLLTDLEAARRTLEWLARDREGCIALLATAWDEAG